MGGVAASGAEPRRYRGVRRRRWGKWVSEIRVPGTRERLWLGSYAAPEAAAVAHDAAVCLLRRGGGGRRAAAGLNFPSRALAYGGARARGEGALSPSSVQRVASDAGMAADAQIVDLRRRRDHPTAPVPAPCQPADAGAAVYSSSSSSSGSGAVAVAVAGDGARRQGTRGEATDTDWCSHVEDGSRSWSCGSEQQLIVYGDLSVDDMEILM
ncbi:ethylene-responsive transcription factor RAP2-1-like [Oryza brachyantha]|uniref:ethylene-responsive transcription factor RAP2-1-like n=1 Tax=Oryza brachyantha TaxID=4533 RepID=UPI001ADC5A70|nr:ethylene-responsive transcription factor RAP2-1-like [Oryza brachyantha]